MKKVTQKFLQHSCSYFLCLVWNSVKRQMWNKRGWKLEPNNFTDANKTCPCGPVNVSRTKISSAYLYPRSPAIIAGRDFFAVSVTHCAGLCALLSINSVRPNATFVCRYSDHFVGVTRALLYEWPLYDFPK